MDGDRGAVAGGGRQELARQRPLQEAGRLDAREPRWPPPAPPAAPGWWPRRRSRPAVAAAWRTLARPSAGGASTSSTRARPTGSSRACPAPSGAPRRGGGGGAPPGRAGGWGSLNVFNAREAYRFVADLSVYVERAWRGMGVGRALLARLVELGREHGFHKLVLSAFPTSAGGMALYAAMGFRTVGIYREQGRLDGRWVDTIAMEKLL